MNEMERARAQVAEMTRRLIRRSLAIYPVSAGGCSDCDAELQALFAPPYDVASLGISLVRTPRHADLLLVSGCVTRHLQTAVLRAYEAMPATRLVGALGTCACTGGLFGQSYAIEGPLERLLPVDIDIPGCPPSPLAILQGLLAVSGRLPAEKHKP